MKPGKLIIICLAAMTVCSQMDARPKWNPFRKHRKEAVEAPAPKPKKTPLEKFLSKKNLECTGDEIKLYKDGKNLFLEIPDSLKGRTVMLTSTVLESSSPYITRGTDVSPLTTTFELDFTDTLVLLKQPVRLVDVKDGDASIRNALAGSKAQAIHFALPVKYRSKDGSAVIADAGSLFTTEGEKSVRLYAKYFNHNRIAEQTCKDELTLLLGLRHFAGSVGVERELTHAVTTEGNFKEQVSGKYLTSLTLLKPRNMPVRFSDSRLGVYSFAVSQFSATEGVTRKAVARRWNLEDGRKIRIYVDTLINPVWQKAIKEGIEAWNPAFERIGLGSPIEVTPYPADTSFHAEDPMVSRVTVSTGKGENILCYTKYSQLTGEILSVNIDIPGNYLDAVRKASSWTISDVDTRYQTYSLSPEAVADVLRADMMKYFARCLGVGPNAAGSRAYSPSQLRDPDFTRAHGITASVTDGVTFNYLARPGDRERGVVTIIDRIGEYDKYAIEWIYSTFPEGTDEEAALDSLIRSKADGVEYEYVRFPGDKEEASDPRGCKCDLGNDPFEAYFSKMEHIRFAAANAPQWLKDPAIPESYRELYIEWLWLAKSEASSILSSLVGTIETHDLREGRGKYSCIDGDIQRKAVKTILENSIVTEWLTTPELREISGAIKKGTSMDRANALFLSKVFSKAYTVALSEAIAGSTYPLEDYLSDLDRYAIGQLRGGTILPGQDLTAALYINNLIGKSGTLKAIFKDAVSDKDFAAAPAYAELLSLAPFAAEPTSAAPNLNGGIPLEYVETVERASYRHLLRVRGILAEGKARAKDSYTRNRFDYLLGLIDKSINVKDKR